MNKIERRGPGRPPRVVIPPSTPLGIIKEAICRENILELSYFDAVVFKYLFTLLKNLKVRDIYFIFTPDSMSVYTKDNIDNRVLIEFDCNKMLYYYCGKKSINICINRENIQAVFINLNKTIDQINISLESCSDMIQIKLSDNSLQKVKIRNVIISERLPEGDLLNIKKDISDSVVQIDFTLTTRDFKDTISDATNYGDKITIEKHGNNPLLLKFMKAHTNICSEEYNNESKIDLKSNLEENDSFMCILHTILLKCISVSVINNSINIRCLHDNKAILSSSIGELIDFTIMAENLAKFQ